MQQPLLWILLALLLVLAGLGLRLLRQRRLKPTPLPTQWTLTPRPVFNTDERQVYRHLREALPQHILLSKLPLVRFCQPTDPEEVRYWYDLLGAHHVSFAICSANGRVLAAIDLESDRGSNRRALQIKQSVLSACKVSYVRCTADRLPSVPELQLLVPHIGPGAQGPQAAPAVGDGRDSLPGPMAGRRNDQGLLWADSGSLQDSFFGVDGQPSEGGVLSSFGALQSGLSMRELHLGTGLSGGVVVDPTPSPLRH
jgi:hypothetical protein